MTPNSRSKQDEEWMPVVGLSLSRSQRASDKVVDSEQGARAQPMDDRARAGRVTEQRSAVTLEKVRWAAGGRYGQLGSWAVALVVRGHAAWTPHTETSGHSGAVHFDRPRHSCAPAHRSLHALTHTAHRCVTLSPTTKASLQLRLCRHRTRPRRYFNFSHASPAPWPFLPRSRDVSLSCSLPPCGAVAVLLRSSRLRPVRRSPQAG